MEKLSNSSRTRAEENELGVIVDDFNSKLINIQKAEAVVLPTEENVMEIASLNNITVASIEKYPEWHSRSVWKIIDNNNEVWYIKFPKQDRITATDYIDGVSFEVEKKLMILLYNHWVPVPKQFKEWHSNNFDYILESESTWELWANAIESNNHSKRYYLQMNESLWKLSASVHAKKYDKPGNIIWENELYEWWLSSVSFMYNLLGNYWINELKNIKSKTITEKLRKIEEELIQFLESKIEKISVLENDPKDNYLLWNTLQLADVHINNVMLDDDWNISWVFDVEQITSAPPLVQLIEHKGMLFNYYDEETFDDAFNSFIKWYEAAWWNKELLTNTKLSDFEDIIFIIKYLKFIWAYENAEWFRSKWSEWFLDIIIDVVKNNWVKSEHYLAIWDIIREKTQQPKTPNNDI